MSLLNTKQAAERLGLKPRTLEVWRLTGAGPPFVRLSRRAVRYRRADLDKFIEERIAHSTSEQTP